MYNFVVVLKEPGLNFTLGFKTEDAAVAARENIRARIKEENTTVHITDDYGHQLDACPENISAVLIQDQKEAMTRENDQNIAKARANEEFLKRRNDDVELMRLFPAQSSIHPAMGRA